VRRWVSAKRGKGSSRERGAVHTSAISATRRSRSRSKSVRSFMWRGIARELLLIEAGRDGEASSRVGRVLLRWKIDKEVLRGYTRLVRWFVVLCEEAGDEKVDRLVS
jgi:hypothetical protein